MLIAHRSGPVVLTKDIFSMPTLILFDFAYRRFHAASDALEPATSADASSIGHFISTFSKYQQPVTGL